MASIDISLNPGAYNTEDFQRSDYNNEYPTTVEIRATATNMGFGPGDVYLRLYNLAQGYPGEDGTPVESARYTVPAARDDIGISDDVIPGEVDMFISYRITVPDIVIDFQATIEDSQGNQIAGSTFTVNPYVRPTAPELTAGNIDITVI